MRLLLAVAATAAAHGLIRSIEGANNVSMPGLSGTFSSPCNKHPLLTFIVTDGTPRNCVVNACGAQADTAIIRDADIKSGKASPLGKTLPRGPVDAATVMKAFMGMSEAPQNHGAADAVGFEDDIPRAQRREEHKRQMQDLFNLPLVGALGAGGKRTSYPVETIVADNYGQGKQNGLPTCDDDGVVSLVYRQVNQDGAGPLTAAVDGTSGGSDAAAFKDADVVLNMPGVGAGGLSLATNTDFPVKVRMPRGMTCEGKVAGMDNVCIVRVRNQAAAGPFGGAAAFTQGKAARKRALARLEVAWEA